MKKLLIIISLLYIPFSYANRYLLYKGRINPQTFFEVIYDDSKEPMPFSVKIGSFGNMREIRETPVRQVYKSREPFGAMILTTDAGVFDFPSASEIFGNKRDAFFRGFPIQIDFDKNLEDCKKARAYTNKPKL